MRFGLPSKREILLETLDLCFERLYFTLVLEVSLSRPNASVPFPRLLHGYEPTPLDFELRRLCLSTGLATSVPRLGISTTSVRRSRQILTALRIVHFLHIAVIRLGLLQALLEALRICFKLYRVSALNL